MTITSCRSCNHSDLVEILDLGQQHLSDFRADKSLPPTFPLTLLLCRNCTLVQLSETVDRENMYHDGYGYRSGVNEQIRANLKMLVGTGLDYVKNPQRWLDIACNDGTLLSMVPTGVFRAGVDPVKKFKVESQRHADLIIDDYFPSNELSSDLKFDVITSISMFYDLDDPNQFVSTIAEFLAPNGVWIVQQNYLVSMLRNLSFDNVCHEHIEYYSLTAMKHLIDRHNLEIIDAFEDGINGGSIITVIAHQGSRIPNETVEKILESENLLGVSDPQAYTEFEQKVIEISKELYTLVSSLKEQNKSIYIYGASTRGAVIWQKVGLNSDLIDFAVERQEEKFGKYFSAISVPIISELEMRKNPPDYLLVGPWFLRDSFIAREQEYLHNGGRMIIPLPKIEIIEI
jgi:NDP-4-keto-2,6-dideoxyhexose 3-C-methyltransferase